MRERVRSLNPLIVMLVVVISLVFILLIAYSLFSSYYTVPTQVAWQTTDSYLWLPHIARPNHAVSGALTDIQCIDFLGQQRCHCAIQGYLPLHGVGYTECVLSPCAYVILGQKFNTIAPNLCNQYATEGNLAGCQAMPSQQSRDLCTLAYVGISRNYSACTLINDSRIWSSCYE